MAERIDEAKAIVKDETQYERVKDEMKDGWYGANLETEGTPIIDKGIGKQVLIREFLFKINPEVKDIETVSRQTIFNTHARHITALLWGDGLIPLETNPPRVIIDVSKRIYRIFVPCEARLGTTFADKTRNLSEELKKDSTS